MNNSLHNCMRRMSFLFVTALFGISLLDAAPVDEFKEGHKNTFSSKDHPKSKGLNLLISYPKSWIAKEGERPNIVQKFISEQGKGIASALIITKEIPENVSNEEIASLLKEPNLSELCPSDAIFVDGKETKIEGNPAAIISYKQKIERAGNNMEFRFVAYYFLNDKMLVSFICSVAGPVENPKLLDYAERLYEPLFFQMANSIILPDKYQTSATDDHKTPSDSPRNQVFISEEHDFSMQYPRDWSAGKTLHSQTIIRVSSPDDDDYNITVVSDPAFLKMTPERYSSEMLTQVDALVSKILAKNYPDARLAGKGLSKLSQQTAVYYLMDFTLSAAGKGIPMRSYAISTIYKGKQYTLTFRTTKERFNDYYPMIQNLALEFQFTKTKLD